jgi:hypothetical protein
MSLTQRFFAEGEIQEARAWKNSPLLFDETTEPEATKFRSFDRVPRRWTPIAIATLLVAMAGAGGAWAIGLWQPPAQVVTWARRFDPRVIFTPTAPSAAALVNSTPANPSEGAPRVEAAAPVPTSAAAPAATPTTMPTPTTEVNVPAAPSGPAAVNPAAAAVAATAEVPVAHQPPAAAPVQEPGAAPVREPAAAPVREQGAAVPVRDPAEGMRSKAMVVPLPAPQAATPARGEPATEAELGTRPEPNTRPEPSTRPLTGAEPAHRPARHDRVTGRTKARHGYVWSDRRGNLIPAMPAAAETTSAAPDDTLPLSAASVPGTRATQGSSSSARTAGAWDSERTDTEQPAPQEAPRQHAPTSSASATEPPPIPVPAIDPPKKLPEPAETAAPSAR